MALRSDSKAAGRWSTNANGEYFAIGVGGTVTGKGADLLIIDDFGLQPLDSQNRNMLLEIMEDRHGKRSTIITSQLPVVNWYDIIGEQTIADAILDRIVHDAHRIELNGESLRKRYGMKKEMDIITMQ